MARTIPGCHDLDRVGTDSYRADVSLGVGIVKGRFVARVALSDLDPPSAARLSGGLEGPLGVSAGTGHVRLAAHGTGTRIDYDYRIEISGKAAAVGHRMLEGATRILIEQFFRRLTSEMERGTADGTAVSWWQRLMRTLGLAR